MLTESNTSCRRATPSSIVNNASLKRALDVQQRKDRRYALNASNIQDTIMMLLPAAGFIYLAAAGSRMMKNKQDLELVAFFDKPATRIAFLICGVALAAWWIYQVFL